MINNRLVPLVTFAGFEKLTQARVAVIGLGGVGGIACEALARSGVGHILLCDFDQVEASNINRQVVATTQTIGKSKVEVMASIICAINPVCEIICYPRPYQNFLEEYKIQYVIDAIDDVPAKIRLITDCLALSLPFISSMGAGNKMNPELIRVINIHKTTHDPLARIIRSNFRDQSFEVVASSEEVKRISGETMIGSYMPVVATFGLFASDYIIKEILRRPLCS